MYKKIIAALIILFLYTNTAVAQSDASIVWSVSNIPGYQEIRIDVKLTTNFIAANGVFIDNNGASVPLTGTCFQTPDRVFCNFSFTTLTLVVNADNKSLEGTVRIVDANFNDAYSGRLRLKSIR